MQTIRFLCLSTRLAGLATLIVSMPCVAYKINWNNNFFVRGILAEHACCVEKWMQPIESWTKFGSVKLMKQ